MMRTLLAIFLVSGCVAHAQEADSINLILEQNAAAAREAILFCHRYAHGWLAQADSETGLLPRNLTQDPFWNGKDAAADNYPFLALTASVTGLYHMERAARHILEQEKRLCETPGGLPGVFDFRLQSVPEGGGTLSDRIFGAAEYIKDGLMPVVEWSGPGPWLDRMQELARAIYEQAESNLSEDVCPSENIEVCGDLMQAMSRLYWCTRDAWYNDRCFRLADRYLLERPVTGFESIRLRDHGCEIIGGLSEIYVIAAREDPERYERYRPALYALLDLILAKGVNEDGMMPDWFNPATAEQHWERISDGWGYVYDAFLTVAAVDDNDVYRDAVRHALNNIHKYLGADWEKGSADGYADTIEGALNLLNRLPMGTAFEWVDESMWHIFDKQREDGIVEGWHGDGNSARTALMYALWKTQGVAVRPWRDDVYVGAVVDDAGALHLSLRSDWQWKGTIRFDRPRHRDHLGLPEDYPRINQFPEWFTVDGDATYRLQVNDEDPREVAGRDLWNLPLLLEPGRQVSLTVAPVEPGAAKADIAGPLYGSMKYTRQEPGAVQAWQEELRSRLAGVLRVPLDLGARGGAPKAEVVDSVDGDRFQRRNMLLNTRSGTIPVILTVPAERGNGPFPAVVCIHGHGGTRESVYDQGTIYHGFADRLAASGVVTIAADVGQHQIRQTGVTLLGERLEDLMRCVDLLQMLPEVDAQRIGCAGLSLGGEMAMWLGALDTRVRATVSAGFLTVMNQMEKNHCMCWKEAGLRELADFPDIYALVAPRALSFQIGKQEPLSQFNTVIAKRVFSRISKTYEDLGREDQIDIEIHTGGHEVHVETLLSFFLGRLGV